MQAQAILHAKEVSKIYGEQQRPALDRVSFDAYSGDFIGIMGASGSGKTTLLNVLSTIDKPTGGEIVIGSVNVNQLDDTRAADFRSGHLGFIFQEYFSAKIGPISSWSMSI